MISTDLATAYQQPERLLVFTKGAPGILLGRCQQIWDGDGPHPLIAERRARIRTANEQLAGEALRTLGIAYHSVPRDALTDPDAVSDQVEQELVFLGPAEVLQTQEEKDGKPSHRGVFRQPDGGI